MSEINTLHRSIILSYLTSYEPGDEQDPHKVMKSSADIQDELSDMVEIDIDEITEVMHSQGYSISVCIDSRPRWLLKRK
jgi:hypothetical protein